MRHCLLTYVTVFLIDLGGNCFEKKKIGLFFNIFEMLNILKIRDSSFVVLLILHHFI